MNSGICDFFFYNFGYFRSDGIFFFISFKPFFPVCTVCSVLFSALAIF